MVLLNEEVLVEVLLNPELGVVFLNVGELFVVLLSPLEGLVFLNCGLALAPPVFLRPLTLS